MNPSSNKTTEELQKEKLANEVQVELLKFKKFEQAYSECWEKLDLYMMRLGLHKYYSELFDIHDCSEYLEQAVVMLFEAKLSIEESSEMEHFEYWRNQLILNLSKAKIGFIVGQTHPEVRIPFDLYLPMQLTACQYLPNSMKYSDGQKKYEVCNSIRVFSEYAASKYGVKIQFIPASHSETTGNISSHIRTILKL